MYDKQFLDTCNDIQLKDMLIPAIQNQEMIVLKYLIVERGISLSSCHLSTDYYCSYCINTYKPLCAAVLTENLEIVKLLVENGADVNEIWDNDNYPDIYAIDFAVGSNNLDIVKYLIEKGAKLDTASRGPAGIPVVTNALLCDNDVSKYFVANMDEIELTKHFCWALARMWNDDDCISIIKTFVKLGAKINAYVLAKIDKFCHKSAKFPALVNCIQKNLGKDVDIEDLVIQAKNIKPNEIFDMYD